MTVAGRGHRAVSGAGLLAVGVPMLLAVCYLAGCGQRGPLTLPAPRSGLEAVPAAGAAGSGGVDGAAGVDEAGGVDGAAGQENAPEPGEDETDERDLD